MNSLCQKSVTFAELANIVVSFSWPNRLLEQQKNKKIISKHVIYFT